MMITSRGRSKRWRPGQLQSMSRSPSRAAATERCPPPHPLPMEAGTSSAAMAWASPTSLPLGLRPRKVPPLESRGLELREASLLLFGPTRPRFRSSLLRVLVLAARCWSRCRGFLMKEQLQAQLGEALQCELPASLLGPLMAQHGQTQALLPSLPFPLASPRFPPLSIPSLLLLLSFPRLPPPSLLPFPQGSPLAGLPKWIHSETTLQS